MKRATITLPDDLDRALEAYVQTQEARPALTAVVQSALREYLGDRGFLRRSKSFRITPAVRGSGQSDVSANHDAHLARR